MTQDSVSQEGTTRRAAMAGAGLAAALTACGASGGSGSGSSQGTSTGGGSGSTGSGALASTSEIPVSNGTIDCPCHGSEFSAKNGGVVSGPAPSPLPRKPITVAGGKITLA